MLLQIFLWRKERNIRSAKGDSKQRTVTNELVKAKGDSKQRTVTNELVKGSATDILTG